MPKFIDGYITRDGRNIEFTKPMTAKELKVKRDAFETLFGVAPIIRIAGYFVEPGKDGGTVFIGDGREVKHIGNKYLDVDLRDGQGLCKIDPRPREPGDFRGITLILPQI